MFAIKRRFHTYATIRSFRIYINAMRFTPRVIYLKAMPHQLLEDT